MENFGNGTPTKKDPVTATLWFIERHRRFESEKPYLFTYPLDDSTFPSNMKHEPRDGILVRNLRSHVPPYNESGIGLLDLQTDLEHDDYDRTDVVERKLLPKVREALRVFLGANTVHIIEYKVCMLLYLVKYSSDDVSS